MCIGAAGTPGLGKLGVPVDSLRIIEGRLIEFTPGREIPIGVGRWIETPGRVTDGVGLVLVAEIVCEGILGAVP